ncbi:unnamed protein product [Aphanomyces euteiches]
MQTDAATDKLDDAADCTLARRQYFQRKQREYRRRVKSERLRLLEELARLQDRKATDRPRPKLVDEDGMLSWQVVASVYQEATGEAKEKQRRLHDQADANLSLIYYMMRFLQACRPRPIASISNALPLHQHVTLLGNGEARARSKQWLVQQLYYNTDRFFDTLPAIDASDEFVDCKAECAGRWVNTVDMCQVTWPYSLEEIKALFARPESQKKEVERDGNTVLAHGLMDDKYPWYQLQGYFYEADRFVVVFRHVHDDEARLERGDADFHEFEWYDRRPSDLVQAVGLRFLGHRSMLIDDVKAFARETGEEGDLLAQKDVDDKTIEREMSAFDKEMLWKFQQDLQTTMAQLSKCTIAAP